MARSSASRRRSRRSFRPWCPVPVLASGDSARRTWAGSQADEPVKALRGFESHPQALRNFGSGQSLSNSKTSVTRGPFRLRVSPEHPAEPVRASGQTGKRFLQPGEGEQSSWWLRGAPVSPASPPMSAMSGMAARGARASRERFGSSTASDGQTRPIPTPTRTLRQRGRALRFPCHRAPWREQPGEREHHHLHLPPRRRHHVQHDRPARGRRRSRSKISHHDRPHCSPRSETHLHREQRHRHLHLPPMSPRLGSTPRRATMHERVPSAGRQR